MDHWYLAADAALGTGQPASREKMSSAPGPVETTATVGPAAGPIKSLPYRDADEADLAKAAAAAASLKAEECEGIE